MSACAGMEFTVILRCLAVQLFLNCWLDWTRSGCSYTPGAPVITGLLAEEDPALFKQNAKSPLYRCSGKVGGGMGGDDRSTGPSASLSISRTKT